ncbi:MAG: heme NO-binding domain-containing protein [Rhodobacteraceae bacterium]|nr:heme NO-binding domain-containing protein [Paracoccaceae bacterium]
MQGLINRSLQSYLVDTYGPELWAALAEELALPEDEPDPASAEAGIFDRLAAAAARRLDLPLPLLLEEYGLYLHGLARVRRLVRLCAETFEEFLCFISDMPDRVRMALPGLAMPGLDVALMPDGEVRIDVLGPPMQAHVLCGFLRGVSDDFGALSLVTAGDNGTLAVRLVDPDFGKARSFSLALPPARDAA